MVSYFFPDSSAWSKPTENTARMRRCLMQRLPRDRRTANGVYCGAANFGARVVRAGRPCASRRHLRGGPHRIDRSIKPGQPTRLRAGRGHNRLGGTPGPPRGRHEPAGGVRANVRLAPCKPPRKQPLSFATAAVDIAPPPAPALCVRAGTRRSQWAIRRRQLNPTE